MNNTDFHQQNSALVLIVDDDIVMRLQLCRAMEQTGYLVAEASDGEQALAAYTHLHPDIVLLDALMPVMDGFTCCAQLQTLPDFERTPILMLTALEDQESVDLAFEAGATDYITKPIHWAVLRQRVRRLLQSSRAQEELRQQTSRARISEERLRLAMGAAQMGTWEWDLPSDKVTYSLSTEVNFGLALGSSDGTYQSFVNNIHPEDRELFAHAVRRTVESGAEYNIEFRVIWQDGSIHWLASRGQVYYDQSGQAVRMTGINMEITSRKQAESVLRKSIEELAQLNRSKDDFLSTVSHELRTPMTNMKMAISMLKMVTSATAKERYLKILQAECDREIELINDLLDLQRLEAASYDLSLKSIILQNWLLDIIEPFRSRTQSRQQILQVNISAELPPLLSDCTSLGRILAELLNNACKYTSSGGEIVLSVRHSSSKPAISPDKTPVTIFTVRNQAEIPAAALPLIFDKFYRIPNADPWRQRGTGLGLALVQKLAARLQGTISVESSRGWTTFTVSLPNHPELNKS